jgi:hypothetical protein
VAWASPGNEDAIGRREMGTAEGEGSRSSSMFARLRRGAGFAATPQNSSEPDADGGSSARQRPRRETSISLVNRNAKTATEAMSSTVIPPARAACASPGWDFFVARPPPREGLHGAQVFSGPMRLLRAAMFSDERLEPDANSQPASKGVQIGGEIRFTLRHLQARVYSMQRIVMILALIGLASAIAVNEWCWLGYIPTPEEEIGYCADPTLGSKEACQGAGFVYTSGIPNPMKSEDGGKCDDTVGSFLKVSTTVLTAILLIAVFHLYEVVAIELNMRNHLEYHKPYVNLPFWELGLLPGFALEFLACCVHPAPGIVGFIEVEARGRLSVYNIESWCTAISFVRFYTVWRYFREWLFTRYTSKHFASRMNDVPMDSKLALKAILEDKPFHTIFFAFLLMTFTLAYLVRICESPLNIEHIYFWNQLWLIVVTATSTGYGDIYPFSHVGRGVCVFAMLSGISLTAILISAVSSKLALNAGESRLMNFLQSENWEKEIRHAGARCIQSWWRRSILHPQTLSALRDFKNKRKSYRKFLEATPHFGAFVETIKDENTEIKDTLAKIELSVAQRLPTQDAPMGVMGVLDAFGSPNKNGKGARGGNGGNGKPMPTNAFEQLMLEVANLRKANEQLQKAVEDGLAGRAAAGAAVPGVATGAAAGALGAMQAATGAPVPRDAATASSKAVEERVKRLEAQVTNLDKGMAKCLGQIVRLLQGLY